MKNTRFYICETCGNVIGFIDGNPERLSCCGKPMQLLVANAVDASKEKHLPYLIDEGDEVIVKIGAVEHPMEKEHYISWVAQVSENETTRIRLHPGEKPEVKFKKAKNATIYAYCNKHGLWGLEIK